MITDERYFNLNEMKKSELIKAWKDYVFPNRKKGGIIKINGFLKERVGADMSFHRPKIGDDEYTWGEIESYPEDMVRILFYQQLSAVKVVKGEEE